MNLDKVKKRAGIACLAALALTAAGYGACALASLEQAWWLAPLAATAAAVLLWQAVKWGLLCKEARDLAPTFRLPLLLSTLCPAWALLFCAACALFSTGAAEETLGFWLFTLVLLVLVPAAPVAALALGVWAVVLGARHLKATTDADGRLYRELPLALSALMLTAVAAVAAVGVFYVLA